MDASEIFAVVDEATRAAAAELVIAAMDLARMINATPGNYWTCTEEAQGRFARAGAALDAAFAKWIADVLILKPMRDGIRPPATAGGVSDL